MKILILSGIFLCFTFGAIAQQSALSNAKTSVVSTTTYTWTDSNNSSRDGHENINISISQSEDNYHLAANFAGDQYIQLKEILLNKFGKEDIENNGIYDWKLGSNAEEAYKIKLTPKTLRMNLNKSLSSLSLQEKFISTGNDIMTSLSGNRNISTEKLKRMAERMRKEARQIENKVDQLLDQKEFPGSDRKEIEQLMKKAEKLMERANELLNTAGAQESNTNN